MLSPKTDCDRYSLLLYKGTAEEFLNELSKHIPNRPTPVELIPREYTNLLPTDVSNLEKLSFASDFELVPGIVPTDRSVSRFFYGNTATWQDLGSEKDIGRSVTGKIVQMIENVFLNTNDGPKIILLEERTGYGKTTVIRRAMFELAKQGISSLDCLATSQIEPTQTAATIDLIDGPLAIMIDNFADQVVAITELVERLTKRDVVFLGAERIYRSRYIEQAMMGAPYEKIGGLRLREIDAQRLIEQYRKYGLLGAPDLAKRRRRREFVRSIQHDPIAIACCRILNDLRPLNGIVDSLIEATSEPELRRYLITALGHYCFRSGIRHSVLRYASGGGDWRRQFVGTHQLPLVYSSYDNGDYVLPENATLASSILQRIADNRRAFLLSIFVDLANAIAPRVNPIQIRRRAPEAKIAARLFDYDQVVSPFLGELASAFYERTKPNWEWNSRYWTQVALMYLALYFSKPERLEGREALIQAGYHARHARSIEEHPVVLTTLGQVLIAQMNEDTIPLSTSFDEAFDMFIRAMELEQKWIRPSVHPFVGLFRGALEYSEKGGVISTKQLSTLRDIEFRARGRFARDSDVQETLAQVRRILF